MLRVIKAVMLFVKMMKYTPFLTFFNLINIAH